MGCIICFGPRRNLTRWWRRAGSWNMRMCLGAATVLRARRSRRHSRRGKMCCSTLTGKVIGCCGAALPADVVGVFILPPSIEALADRLRGRGDADEAVAKRMAEAEAEISHAGEFDHVVVNDDFDATLAELTAFLSAARVARMA